MKKLAVWASYSVPEYEIASEVKVVMAKGRYDLALATGYRTEHACKIAGVPTIRLLMQAGASAWDVEDGVIRLYGTNTLKQVGTLADGILTISNGVDDWLTQQIMREYSGKLPIYTHYVSP